MKSVSNHILLRVYTLFGLFLLFGGLIVLRVIIIQWNKSEWVQKEIEDQVFFKKMVADRGNIVSEDGTIMATSLPFYRIALDPTIIDTTASPNFNDSLMLLAANLVNHFGEEGEDTLFYYNRVKEALVRGDKHVYLSRKKLNFKELEMVKTWPILNWGRYKGGLVIEKFNNERFYPMGELARITLGRLADDTLGVRGIEYSFNRELRGRDGYILAQKVVGDSYVPLDEYGDDGSRDGLDVVTTLDVDLQDVVETALKSGVEKHQAKYGTAILMEVKTGKIKALANYPENQNHGIATQVEPGSTFKTASALALMEDNLIDVCDTIDTGNGSIMYDDKEVTDNGHAWGAIEFEKVFAQSSNVGMSMAVNEHFGANPARYMEHLKNFGFFQTTDFQLSGEPQPIIITPDSKEWTMATLPSLSYGYSLQVTPLQMATFYNGVANQGTLMRPWIVKEIRDNSRVIASYGAEVMNPQMCSKEAIGKIWELMKAVVIYGTAQPAFRGLPFEVAGKTGTARKIENGQYVRKYRASFGGFFPANNPRYTLYIMIDEPEGGYASGGTVAAPIFREIAGEIYSMDLELSKIPRKEDPRPTRKPANQLMFTQSAKAVYPELGINTSILPEGEWVKAESNGHQINLVPFDKEVLTVPNVRGMTSRDAITLLERLGLKVVLRGTGRVRRQSLLPGYKLGNSSSITLFLG
ncbi:MAG: penicillin-binding protein [Bacteroidia bacterium]|nr:penicillin-binding protein [Bacteroidia bacterium]